MLGAVDLYIAVNTHPHTCIHHLLHGCWEFLSSPRMQASKQADAKVCRDGGYYYLFVTSERTRQAAGKEGKKKCVDG